MQPCNADKRRETRVVTNEKVSFVALGSSPDRECRGVIVNMSGSGIGLYHYCSLAAGEEIRIRDVVSNMCREGVVCWVRKVDDISNLAGISCQA